MRKNKYLVFFALVIVGAAIGSTVAWGFYRSGYGNKEYEYLAKRIQVENPNNIKINFTTLRYDITGYIHPWRA